MTGVIEPDRCPPPYHYTSTQYGFPLKHSGTIRGSGEGIDLAPSPPFYGRELAVNIFFWTTVSTGLHFIAIRLLRHKSERKQTIK